MARIDMMRVLCAAVCWIVLTAAVAYGAWLPLGGAPGPGFSGVTYGQFAVYGNGACPAAKCVSADTWYSTWADDGNIYATAGDINNAGGWNGSTSGLNFMFSKLDGYTSAMTGTMTGDTTRWGAQGQQDSSDHATYKPSGVIAVHGALYVSIYRQPATGNIPSLNAQLIKSVDHGVNWTPLPPAQAVPYSGTISGYVTPTFTDVKFRWPAFLQYPWPDYTGQTVDRSDQFVYAYAVNASTGSAFSGTADTLWLARVPVATIGNLAIGDWQYYQGGDGALDSSWGPTSSMVPVINEPGCGCHYNAQAIAYLPYWKKYILIDYQWNVATTTTWSVYQGDHPWGPWVKRQSNVWGPPGTAQTLNAYGFYYFGIIAKSIAADGGKTFTMLTTGDYLNAPMYTMFIVPVTVNP